MDEYEDLVSHWALLGVSLPQRLGTIFSPEERSSQFPKEPLTLRIGDQAGEMVGPSKALEPLAPSPGASHVKCKPVTYEGLPSVVLTHYAIFDRDGAMWKCKDFDGPIQVTSGDHLRVTVRLDIRDLALPGVGSTPHG